MTFFVSYPISTRDSHISPRAEYNTKNVIYNLYIIYFLLLICTFSLADILNSSFSNNESAVVAVIDIDKKTTGVFTEQHDKCLQTDLRKKSGKTTPEKEQYKS